MIHNPEVQELRALVDEAEEIAVHTCGYDDCEDERCHKAKAFIVKLKQRKEAQ